MNHYDAVVIGAGQGGDPLARAWAAPGGRSPSSSARYVGGTCVNTGCTPTKTMVASARVAYLARRGADFGVQTRAGHGRHGQSPSAQAQAIVERLSRRHREEASRSKRRGTDLRRGALHRPEGADCDAERRRGRDIDGGPDLHQYRRSARRPPIDGLDDVPYLDNATIEELDAVPEHLLILGGGYIALEFGRCSAASAAASHC